MRKKYSSKLRYDSEYETKSTLTIYCDIVFWVFFFFLSFFQRQTRKKYPEYRCHFNIFVLCVLYRLCYMPNNIFVFIKVLTTLQKMNILEESLLTCNNYNNYYKKKHGKSSTSVYCNRSHF